MEDFDLMGYIIAPELVLSAITFALAMLVWTLTRKFFFKLLRRKDMVGKKANNLRMAMSLIKYTIFLIAGMVIMEIYGVDVTALVASIGVAGVVIGVALQDMLKDIIMGTNILMDDYFAVGDIVSYGDIRIGEVTDFNMKATRIRDLANGNTVIVSNRSITEIIKVSEWQIVDVPAPYWEKPERMRNVCSMICGEAEKKETVKKCSFLGTGEFADSYISYKLSVSSEPADKLSARRAVLGTIQDVFDKEHIDIPYPQLDVHIGKDE